MKPKIQLNLYFVNKANCIVDLSLLEKSMLWFTKENLKAKRVIYMHGHYPAVTIFNTKIHVHRLIKSYLERRTLNTVEYVHHKNENKLDASENNLEILIDSIHQSLHNKGKVLTTEHRHRISMANSRRKGKPLKPQRIDVTPKMVFDMKQNGFTFNAISKILNIDWTCVKSRFNTYISQNTES